MEQRTFTNQLHYENLKITLQFAWPIHAGIVKFYFCTSCNWKHSSFLKETEFICLLFMLKICLKSLENNPLC